MNFTDDARALLCHLEGCRLNAYRDQAGVWTIGWGHTGIAGGTVWTQEQADKQLEEDVHRFSLGVERLVAKAPIPLNDHQFSALVIFSFNVGLVALMNSTAMKRLLGGFLDQVPGELVRWNKIHDRSGVPLVDPILAKRREAEVRLWNTPVGVA